MHRRRIPIFLVPVVLVSLEKMVAWDMAEGWEEDMVWGQGGMGWARFNNPQQLAILKSQIGVRPNQEEAWNTYVKTVQDQETALSSLWKERQVSRADFHTRRQGAFQAISNVAATLSASLDDEQKIIAQTVILPGLGYGMPKQ